MAETKYEIGLLNYTCDTYESAIEFLDTFGKHKPGQPICVLYGEEGNLKALFAVGTEAGNGYDIVGSVNASDIAKYVKWFTLDEDGNPVPDQNQLRLIHNLPDDFDLEELSNGSNLLFIPVNDEIGYIYHNGVLYASPYIEDKITKGELTVGETTYEEGTPLTDIIVDILEKIDPDNVKVKWENVTDKPEKVEDAFNCSSFLKKENNLSELLNKQLAARNLLIWDSMVNNTILKIENGEIKWGNVTIGWYHGDDPIPGTEVRFVKMSKAEYEALTSPSIYKLYFVDAGGGTFELFLGPYPIKPTSYNIYKNPNPPSDLQEQYMLLDSGGNTCGATIDIPKDKFVTHAELKTVTEPDVPYEGAQVGDEYIDLEIMNAGHIYIPLGDLNVPQSDWFENNKESGAYVKNRTHYPLYDVQQSIYTTSNGLISTLVRDLYITNELHIPADTFEEGKFYTVRDLSDDTWLEDCTVECKLVDDFAPAPFDYTTGDWYVLGNMALCNGIGSRSDYPDTGESFLIAVKSDGSASGALIESDKILPTNPPYGNEYPIVLDFYYTEAKFRQLDEHYIPDTIARSKDVKRSDWWQNDPDEMDHVLHRTHYIQTTGEIGEPTTIESGGGLALYFNPTIPFVSGELYRIKIGNEIIEFTPTGNPDNSSGGESFSLTGGGGGLSWNTAGLGPNNETAYLNFTGNPQKFAGKPIEIYKLTYIPLDDRYISNNIARITDIKQSDWWQNDPTKQDHILHRTHYIELHEMVGNSMTIGQDGRLTVYFDPTVPFVTGETYRIMIGDLEVEMTVDGDVDSLRGAGGYTVPNGGGGVQWNTAGLGPNNETAVFNFSGNPASYAGEDIMLYYREFIQLDERYIPNTIARQSSIDLIIEKVAVPPTYVAPIGGIDQGNINIEYGGSWSGSKTATFTQNDAGTLSSATFDGDPFSTAELEAKEKTKSISRSDITTVQTIEAVFNFETGPIKNNNFDIPDERGRILAGNVSAQFTITPVYHYFYGSVGDSWTITSANIRSLTHTEAGSSKTLATGAVNKRFVVAIPTGKSITRVIDEGALGADVTANYILQGTYVVTNGNTDMNYKVYIMEMAVPYTESHNHKITIG